ncbi:peptide ABC transporter substrate-binding protein [Microaerobacter geothermalis]|uniref:peptide ABC transporter substrate-binding protein n=1 Tax=Microaerobacter geothermalis TaxID=674972 RepID=UPI001F398D3D|nr:peptide ABC transporter substrate-binding protein [Microaerobacter geothermalis]MCF6094124.1 peptide ABC transporter substrate-binding protein [Microaerobacter geothermalis]
MKKKLIYYFLIVMSLMLILTGCGKGANETSAPSDNNGNKKVENNVQAPVQMSKEQVITVNALSEPPSLDPALIDNQIAGDIANQLFEGLVRFDKDGNIVPGVAKEWKISDDGTTYTFYLNQDAKWSNGDPVTAEDFIYSWERVLRPETAAPLGSNLFFIKNGVAYNEGTLTDPSQLGLRAIDEYTLEVTLERPTSFFLGLTAFFTLLPINKDVAESNPNWAAEASTFVSNGPFKMESWKHDQEIVMIPNENYWAKDVVKLEKLRWIMVNDQNTEYQLFQSGQLDVSDNPPTNIRSKLVAEGKAGSIPLPRVVYLRFNHEDDVFDNPKIRSALSLAINRQLIVDKVTQGGEIPALAFIPYGLSSGAGEFRKLAGDALYKDNDVETAKALLAEGLKEKGISSLPKVSLLFYTNDTYNKLSQALQEMWKKNLGIEVELKTMERKVFVQTVKGGDYQLAIYSTGADYDDAHNLMGQFTTGDVYNYSRVSIPEYDRLVKAAEVELDLNKRAQLMVDAEKVLIDEMALAPLYFGTKVYLQQENVKNIYRYPIQAIDFREAYVE